MHQIIKKSNKFYIILFMIYVGLTFFVTAFGAIFLWIADNALIISFGLINGIISTIYFDPRFFRSLIIGFLLSSISLIISYFLCFIFFKFDLFSQLSIFFSVGFYALIQTFLWKVIEITLAKFDSVKFVFFSLVPLALILLIAFNAKYYWKLEQFYKAGKDVMVYFKYIDFETKKPFVGETISLRTERQPFYGNIISTELNEKITDSTGIVSFELYKEYNYNGSIWRKDGDVDFFEIKSREITENDTIIIKNNR